MVYGIRRSRGFSLIEIVVTFTIIAILTTTVLPLAHIAVQRSKEAELRQALRDIRAALDAYRAAWEDGRVNRRVGESGYPPSLELLEHGVSDARDPTGRKIRFLRKLPRDPFSPPSVSAAEGWGKRAYASEASEPREGADVYDVYSLNSGIGLNGIPYRDW